MVKRAAPRPILITDAETSQDDQLRRRQIRYVTMMGVRALCLILAAVLVSLQVPLLWLWVTLCVVGMVLLPWMAVLIANDRPPKEQHRMRRHQRADQAPSQVLPSQPADARPVEGRVIDAE